MPVDVSTVTLGDLSGSESLLLLPLVDLVGMPIAAFKVRWAVLLLSILAILSLFPAQADSIEVKLVLFILLIINNFVLVDLVIS